MDFMNFVKVVLFMLAISVITACGPVCVCCCQDNWKYCSGHHATGFPVCLHWSATFQSEENKEKNNEKWDNKMYCMCIKCKQKNKQNVYKVDIL